MPLMGDYLAIAGWHYNTSQRIIPSYIYKHTQHTWDVLRSNAYGIKTSKFNSRWLLTMINNFIRKKIMLTEKYISANTCLALSEKSLQVTLAQNTVQNNISH